MATINQEAKPPPGWLWNGLPPVRFSGGSFSGCRPFSFQSYFLAAGVPRPPAAGWPVTSNFIGTEMSQPSFFS